MTLTTTTLDKATEESLGVLIQLLTELLGQEQLLLLLLKQL